ncbi:MAG TPA: arsinothricin resistance N-acetyltransferase ArsN1 family B [Gammaproteobacteria bacterium]
MIRSAEPDDIKAIAAIYNYYITDTVVSFEETPVAVDEMKVRVNKVLLAGFPWLVAVEGGDVIGYAYACQWNTRTAYKYSAEVSVYLSRAHVSKGWGTRLYDKLFEELKSGSVHTVIGGVALPNPASVALHEKFGMEKVAHYKEVGYKFGRWIDVGYWQKKISAG